MAPLPEGHGPLQMPNFVFAFILRTLAAAFWVAGPFRGRRGSSRRPQEKTKKEGFGAVSTPSPDHSQPKHTQPNNTHLPTEKHLAQSTPSPGHTQLRARPARAHPPQAHTAPNRETPSPEHTQPEHAHPRAHPPQSTPTPEHTHPRAHPANAHPCFFVLGFEESAFRFFRSFA